MRLRACSWSGAKWRRHCCTGRKYLRTFPNCVWRESQMASLCSLYFRNKDGACRTRVHTKQKCVSDSASGLRNQITFPGKRRSIDLGEGTYVNRAKLRSGAEAYMFPERIHVGHPLTIRIALHGVILQTLRLPLLFPKFSSSLSSRLLYLRRFSKR